MSKQPEALRLADWLDCVARLPPVLPNGKTEQSAAELRRLHALNAELLEALKLCLKKGTRWHSCDYVVVKANAAISKAEEQQ